MTRNFLKRIVSDVRALVEEPAYLDGVPPEMPAPGPSLRAAIQRDRRAGAVLVEYKRVSPGSAEPRLPSRTVEEFARVVGSLPVTALSCLACAPRFEGSPRDVSELARRVQRPVLFKDFLVSPIQLEAARRCGASAVLVIARMADVPGADFSPDWLAREAHRRGLEVVLELHSEGELRTSEHIPADVYGVNTRDLDTLVIERAVADRTLRAVQSRRPLLGLSGIESSADAAWFWRRGVDGVLVGSGFARASDPEQFVNSLRAARGAGPP